MKIIILFSIIIGIFFIGRNFIYFTKRNLFKNQAAWSGKDIKIKYANSREDSQPKENDNYLKIIAEESKIYLEDELRKENMKQNKIKPIKKDNKK